MRSLATSDRPSVRALSAAIGAVSSRAHARDFIRIMHRMGAAPASIVPHVQDSPNFRDGRFQSSEPSLRPRFRAQTSALLAAIRVHGRGRPVGTVPLVRPDSPAEPGQLAVTWYGHATTVVEVDGARFLIDPVFSERASPSTRTGPKRLHPVPGQIEGIPTIDAVLISHDHYDHLDEPSIVMLEHTHRPHYVVPLGVDFHLVAWGVPADRLTALDWRDETEVSGIRITCTEARHNSGRGIIDSQTLWAGWALRGREHSVFFAGDSGTSKGFAHIGADLARSTSRSCRSGPTTASGPTSTWNPSRPWPPTATSTGWASIPARSRVTWRASPTTSSTEATASTPPVAPTRRVGPPRRAARRRRRPGDRSWSPCTGPPSTSRCTGGPSPPPRPPGRG